jgi:hypothetical protein
MDQWSAFVQDKWILIIIAIVILFLVMKLVKTFVKWILVLAVIAAVVYYGSNYAGELSGLKTTLGTAVANETKQQLTNLIVGEGKDADYVKHSDGSFTVHTKSITLDVKSGSKEAEITFLDHPVYKVPIDKTIQKFIDEAKQNQ